MGTMEELRQMLENVLTPELREIKIQLQYMSQRMDRIETEMGAIRSDVVRQLLALESDLRQFYRTLGQHDVRLDNLEKP